MSVDSQYYGADVRRLWGISALTATYAPSPVARHATLVTSRAGWSHRCIRSIKAADSPLWAGAYAGSMQHDSCRIAAAGNQNCVDVHCTVSC